MAEPPLTKKNEIAIYFHTRGGMGVPKISRIQEERSLENIQIRMDH